MFESRQIITRSLELIKRHNYSSRFLNYTTIIQLHIAADILDQSSSIFHTCDSTAQHWTADTPTHSLIALAPTPPIPNANGNVMQIKAHFGRVGFYRTTVNSQPPELP